MNIIVLGSNFAGVTVAIELRRKLSSEHNVTVVSRNDKFLFIPSLIWVPFGWREISQISTPLKPIYEKAKIPFIQAEGLEILPEKNILKTTNGDMPYDYLVIATGPALDYLGISGLGPDAAGNIHCICSPDGAMKARAGFEELVKDPGPVVVMATQKAGCMGAAYEFLFNMDKALRERGVRKKVELTYITPEPFLGHFGIEGIAGGATMLKGFMGMLDIKYRLNSSVKKVENNIIYLEDGSQVPFKYTMVMPAFKGVQAVQKSKDVGNASGYVDVDDTYRHKKYGNIFSAGIAVAINVPFVTPVPTGVPKTGFPADEQAKTAAENISRLIQGKTKLVKKPFGKIPGLCIMDAGKKEVLIISNHLLKPRQFAIMIPNPVYDISKRLFEKYFLWKTKTARSYLP